MARKYKSDRFFRYVTRRDDRVRKSHAILDWVTKNADDPFWKIYYPPNGFRCRCRVERLSGPGVTSTNTIGLNLHKEVSDIWMFNAATEGKVFSKKHPYFDVAKKDKKLAKNNFNLPLPRGGKRK